VDAQLPSVPKRLDHLGFLGEVLVRAVFDVALVSKGLEVRAVFDAVGRVDIYRLHLTAYALLGQEGVHHQQGVASHQPVRPAFLVAVEIQRLAQRQVLERRREKVRLTPLRCSVLPF